MASAAENGAAAAIDAPPSVDASLQRPQQVGVEVWPEDWFTDMPAVELTGTWNFDAEASDPMIDAWAEAEVSYEITQHAAFIVLTFRAEGMASNTQTYRWDGSIQRFERIGRQVEEAARWSEAGRVLEVVGRHWDPEAPDNRSEYRFTYTARNNVLTFVNEDANGATTWRFVRQRQTGPGEPPGRAR